MLSGSRFSCHDSDAYRKNRFFNEKRPFCVCRHSHSGVFPIMVLHAGNSSGTGELMPNVLKKMRGGGKTPPRTCMKEILLSWLGSCISIALIALIERHVTRSTGFPLLIGSFGASAVLAFGAIQSPLAQPRNLVGGHFVSALTGVTICMIFPDSVWLASCLAVSTAIAVMLMTGTLHPPGGATALIAVTGGEGIRQLGYWYALVPCLTGACLMLLVALIVNNIPHSRRYPLYWW